MREAGSTYHVTADEKGGVGLLPLIRAREVDDFLPHHRDGLHGNTGVSTALPTSKGSKTSLCKEDKFHMSQGTSIPSGKTYESVHFDAPVCCAPCHPRAILRSEGPHSPRGGQVGGENR